MELKDIILKKGDRVDFEPQGEYPTCFIFSGNKECRAENYCERLMVDGWCPKITKIERPVKYETIYEAPKEILDKGEMI